MSTTAAVGRAPLGAGTGTGSSCTSCTAASTTTAGDGEGSAVDIHLPHPRVDARRRPRRAPQKYSRMQRAREEEGPGGPQDGIEAGATDRKHVQGELDDAATGRKEGENCPPARAVRSVE